MLIFFIGFVFFLVLLPFIGWWALVPLGIALFIGWVLWLTVEDCPRAIMGYNCKGKDCDHSPELLMAAKVTMLKK